MGSKGNMTDIEKRKLFWNDFETFKVYVEQDISKENVDFLIDFLFKMGKSRKKDSNRLQNYAEEVNRLLRKLENIPYDALVSWNPGTFDFVDKPNDYGMVFNYNKERDKVNE